MKRLLLALVSILIVPNTASALERLSDSELDAITAQAGIILHAFNDVRFRPDRGEIQ